MLAIDFKFLNRNYFKLNLSNPLPELRCIRFEFQILHLNEIKYFIINIMLNRNLNKYHPYTFSSLAAPEPMATISLASTIWSS
jgi:hypothetical protein